MQIGAVGGTIIAGFRKCVDTLHGDVFFKGLKFDVCAKDPKFILGPVIGALVVGKALQGGKTVAQLKDVTLRREPLKKRDQATRGAAAALTLEAAALSGRRGPASSSVRPRASGQQPRWETKCAGGGRRRRRRRGRF